MAEVECLLPSHIDADEEIARSGKEAEDDNLQLLRSSMSHLSSVIKAHKAARNWRIKSKKHSDGKAQWRIWLEENLESTAFHIFIVVLLLLDLLATAVDLLLTIHNSNSDLKQCSSLLRACKCDAGEFSGQKSWEILHWISVGILCVLLANLGGLVLAFGWAFFKHAGYLLDSFVVITAFVLEVGFEADTAGLLIILNLWRIVRVAHGIFEVTDEAWENEMEEMKKRIDIVEAEHSEDRQLIVRKEQRIAELESELARQQSR